jgi:phosphoribosylanthranilate isomerase
VPKLKICGIKTPADVEILNAHQPDYCGFVFATSLRQVNFNEAAALRVLLSENIQTVGVFTDTPVSDIAGLYKNGVISIAQLHGGQDEDFITELKTACDIPVIQAVKITGRSTLHLSQNADFYLFDGGKPGSGKAFDWADIPETAKPWFLAGGINAGNIHNAIKKKPYCIDVASGAEHPKQNNTYPGKNPEQVARLLQAVRGEIT